METTSVQAMKKDGQRRFLNRYGLQISRGNPCPRRLRGLRCTCHQPSEGLCPCSALMLVQKMPKGEMLVDAAGQPAALVIQPYRLRLADICVLEGIAEDLGLNLEVSAYGSWRNPPFSLLVVMTVNADDVVTYTGRYFPRFGKTFRQGEVSEATNCELEASVSEIEPN